MDENKEVVHKQRYVSDFLVEQYCCTACYFLIPSKLIIDKGQLISKCLLGVIVSTKKPTKFFQGFLPYSYLSNKRVDYNKWVG